MTPDINSRARQLLVDIGLKEPAGDPPEIVAQYERLVAFVADHLRQVAAEAVKERDELRTLLPEQMPGCKIVFKECELGHGWLTATNWVQHGCPVCEMNALRALLAEAGEALKPLSTRRAMDGLSIRLPVVNRAAAALAAIQSALRDASPTTGKPE